MTVTFSKISLRGPIPRNVISLRVSEKVNRAIGISGGGRTAYVVTVTYITIDHALSMFLRELHVFTINRHDSQGLESQSITKHVFT